MEEQKDLKETDRTSLAKIRSFLWQNPSVIYKGVPLAMATYACYPLLVSFWYVLPWIWSGYAMYSVLPTGTLTYLWAALKVYKALG